MTLCSKKEKICMKPIIVMGLIITMLVALTFWKQHRNLNNQHQLSMHQATNHISFWSKNTTSDKENNKKSRTFMQNFLLLSFFRYRSYFFVFKKLLAHFLQNIFNLNAFPVSIRLNFFQMLIT